MIFYRHYPQPEVCTQMQWLPSPLRQPGRALLHVRERLRCPAQRYVHFTLSGLSGVSLNERAVTYTRSSRGAELPKRVVFLSGKLTDAIRVYSKQPSGCFPCIAGFYWFLSRVMSFFLLTCLFAVRVPAYPVTVTRRHIRGPCKLIIYTALFACLQCLCFAFRLPVATFKAAFRLHP